MLSAVEISDISFRPLVEREIEAYINQYAVLSYAGAFERDAVLRANLWQLQFRDGIAGQPTDRFSSSTRRRYLNARQPRPAKRVTLPQG